MNDRTSCFGASCRQLTAALTVWALVSSFFALDVTEYGLVIRFGACGSCPLPSPASTSFAPFDRVVRLEQTQSCSFARRPSEFLTIDKKNLGVDSLVTWRIADPERFSRRARDPGCGRAGVSPIVVLAEIGAVMGRYPASVLISTDPAKTQLPGRGVGKSFAAPPIFARTAYGIDVVSFDIRRPLPSGAEPGARLRTP